MMADTLSMFKEYSKIMNKMDPESAKELLDLNNDTTESFSTATITNWTKSALGYAIQNGYTDAIPPLKAMHQEAKDKMELDDIGNEISGLYDCAFEFKKGELNLESIANMSENRLDKESLSKMESNLDSLGSSIRTAITRAYGMMTLTAKHVKDTIIPQLKNISKSFNSKLKGQFINAFNKLIKYFFQLINEFVSKIFSFVEMISNLGKSKGFSLKSATISFDPPNFNKVSIFGFSIPIPTISLPKVTINFEMTSDRVQTSSDNQISNIKQNGYTTQTNEAIELLKNGKINEFNEKRVKNWSIKDINLYGASLTGALLNNANLESASLTGANLSNSVIIIDYGPYNAVIDNYTRFDNAL
jgi:hypothetical protein